LAVLAFLIALAGGVTIAAVAGAGRADTAFARFTARTRSENVAAFPTFESADLFDPALEPRLAAAFDEAVALPGVVSATEGVLWAATPSPEIDAFQFGLVRSAGEPTRPFVIAGEMPDVNDAHQVVLNELAARTLGVGVGDSLTIHTVAPEQSQEWGENDGSVDDFRGPEVPVTVAAVTRGADDIARAEDAKISLTAGFLRDFGADVFHCRCVVGLYVDPSRVDDLIPRLEAIYAPFGMRASRVEEGQLPRHVAEGITTEVVALRLLAVTAAVAGLIVVAQAMARQAAEAGADNDIRRAMGATRPQLAAGTTVAILPAVLVGTVGAAALAVALSALTPRGLARQAEVDPGVRVDLPVLVAGALVVAVVGAVLAAVASQWAARPPGRDAHRYAPLPGWLRPALMLGASFAVRPGRRGRLAVWSAVVATAIGVSGVLGVWSFEASRHHLLDDPRLYGVDAGLGWNGPRAGYAAAAQAALAEPGVDAVAIDHGIESTVTLTREGRQTSVEPSAMENLKASIGSTVVRGRRPAGPGEVAIGEAVARALAARVGDAVTVVAQPGDGAAHETTVAVVGTVVSWGVDEVTNAFELTPAGLTALTAELCPGDEDCAPEPSDVVVRVAAGPAGRAATAHLIDQHGFGVIDPPSVVGNVGQAGSVPLVLSAFLGCLGLAGLIHALVVTLRRRRRDVVIGRALGLDTRGARSSLRWDAGILTVAGLAVGLPLGVLAGQVAWGLVADRLGVVVDDALPQWAPIVVGVAVLAVAAVAAELPARAAGRLRPAAVLRAE
jgi:ABC-type lipoprotein release transport system permease subunit